MLRGEKPPASAPAVPTRASVVRAILTHNVKLVITEGDEVRKTASGVAIAVDEAGGKDATYLLTNAHAVDMEGLHAPSLVAVVERKGEESVYRSEVVVVGKVPQMDLALVRVTGLKLAPAQLATDDELELGDSVIVAAAPFGKSISLSGGMVSSVELDKTQHTPSMLKTDAPVGYGASGGGIYSLTTGKLLAIVEGYRTAKVGFNVAEQAYSFDVPMPGETFAAPTAKVRAFLAAKGYVKLLAPPTTEVAAVR